VGILFDFYRQGRALIIPPSKIGALSAIIRSLSGPSALDSKIRRWRAEKVVSAESISGAVGLLLRVRGKPKRGAR
jgi:hypothetical protein